MHNTISARRFCGSLRAALSSLRSQNGDLSSPAARARERQRRVFLAATVSMLAKIISVGTALISIPVTLHYLGSERFGMWLVVSSLIAMLSFADLGMGNGILNMVASAYGRDDTAGIQQVISSGLAMLTLVSLLLLTAFGFAYPRFEWFRLFNVDSPLARAEAGPAIAVFAVGFAASIPTSVIQRAQMGLQNGFIASTWLCIGSVLSLFGVLLAVWLQAGLPWLVAAFMGGPIAANFINGLVFFYKTRRDIRPKTNAINWFASRGVLKSGIMFFTLQLSAAVIYNSHNFLIAQILGADSVPLYAVPEKLFSLITITVTMALTPLWPAYRESIERGDSEWAKRTLLRSIQVAVSYATFLSLPLIFISPWIIRYWIGESVSPPFLLLLGLGIWKIIEAGGLALAMFLNGTHQVKAQVICSSATAILAIVTEISLLKAIGVSGTVWATIIAFVICALIPYSVLVPKIIKSLDRGSRK